uniref:Uncharacterized protein n=1 Tax=Panagrellus redivivus TaxID=6233 RepID=A0A7E4WCK3_PANRE
MSQFSWDDPGVTNLLDTYIHNSASGSADSDDPTTGSARAIANTLSQRYDDPNITRHMVHHQIKKRRRILNGERSPPKAPGASAGATSRNPNQGRRSGRLRGSPPPSWFNNSGDSTSSQFEHLPAALKKIAKPSSATNNLPRAAKTAQRPRRHAIPSDNAIRNEFVLTLQRAQALMSAQIALTHSQTAYYNRRDQVVPVIDLRENE